MSVSGSNDESAAVTGVTVREPVAAVALTKPSKAVVHRPYITVALFCCCIFIIALGVGLGVGLNLKRAAAGGSVAIFATLDIPATTLSSPLALAARCDVASAILALGVVPNDVTVTTYLPVEGGQFVAFAANDPANAAGCSSTTASRVRRAAVESTCMTASMTRGVENVNVTAIVDSKLASAAISRVSAMPFLAIVAAVEADPCLLPVGVTLDNFTASLRIAFISASASDVAIAAPPSMNATAAVFTHSRSAAASMAGSVSSKASMTGTASSKASMTGSASSEASPSIMSSASAFVSSSSSALPSVSATQTPTPRPVTDIYASFDIFVSQFTEPDVTPTRCALAEATSLSLSRILLTQWVDAFGIVTNVNASNFLNVNTTACNSSDQQFARILLEATPQGSAAVSTTYTVSRVLQDDVPNITDAIKSTSYPTAFVGNVSSGVLLVPASPSTTPSSMWAAIYSDTNSRTPSITPSANPTVSDTQTQSVSPTFTQTSTLTPSYTQTRTQTGTQTVTQTQSASPSGVAPPHLVILGVIGGAGGMAPIGNSRFIHSDEFYQFVAYGAHYYDVASNSIGPAIDTFSTKPTSTWTDEYARPYCSAGDGVAVDNDGNIFLGAHCLISETVARNDFHTIMRVAASDNALTLAVSYALTIESRPPSIHGFTVNPTTSIIYFLNHNNADLATKGTSLYSVVSGGTPVLLAVAPSTMLDSYTYDYHNKMVCNAACNTLYILGHRSSMYSVDTATYTFTLLTLGSPHLSTDMGYALAHSFYSHAIYTFDYSRSEIVSIDLTTGIVTTVLTTQELGLESNFLNMLSMYENHVGLYFTSVLADANFNTNFVNCLLFNQTATTPFVMPPNAVYFGVSLTPSVTPSQTASSSATASQTPSYTSTPTVTTSGTHTPSGTPSGTPSQSITPTVSPTASISPSPSNFPLAFSWLDTIHLHHVLSQVDGSSAPSAVWLQYLIADTVIYVPARQGYYNVRDLNNFLSYRNLLLTGYLNRNGLFAAVSAGYENEYTSTTLHSLGWKNTKDIWNTDKYFNRDWHFTNTIGQVVSINVDISRTDYASETFYFLLTPTALWYTGDWENKMYFQVAPSVILLSNSLSNAVSGTSDRYGDFFVLETPGGGAFLSIWNTRYGLRRLITNTGFTAPTMISSDRGGTVYIIDSGAVLMWTPSVDLSTYPAFFTGQLTTLISTTTPSRYGAVAALWGPRTSNQLIVLQDDGIDYDPPSIKSLNVQTGAVQVFCEDGVGIKSFLKSPRLLSFSHTVGIVFSADAGYGPGIYVCPFPLDLSRADIFTF